MLLSDYYSREMKEGNYIGEVKEFRIFFYKSGSQGVEFTISTKEKDVKVSFVLVEKALWKLASFAKACKLSQKEAANYDIEDDNSHSILIGKELIVTIKNNERGYPEVVGWQELDKNIAKAKVKNIAKEDKNITKEDKNIIKEEEIPF